MDLQTKLLNERLNAYGRLRGGFPIPMAGALWWLGLAGVGYAGASRGLWIFVAAAGSGLLFPMAILLGKLFGRDFMKDRTAVTPVLFPAFLSMLLFWPMAISAWWTAPQLFPLILAIGMSLHWPVIGWTYGRTAIYSGHAVVRALLAFYIWNAMPDDRLTILPLSVAVVYAVTVLVIWVDSGKFAKTQLPADQPSRA